MSDPVLEGPTERSDFQECEALLDGALYLAYVLQAQTCDSVTDLSARRSKSQCSLEADSAQLHDISDLVVLTEATIMADGTLESPSTLCPPYDRAWSCQEWV